MSETLKRLGKGTPEDWPSLSLLEFTVALAKAMKANGGMRQKDLAEALGVSPPYISSVMSGNENLTVEQMSRLAEAAGGSLHLTIAPQGRYIKWVEDALEETATEAAISPSLHSHAMVPTTPMNHPLPKPPIEAPRYSPGPMAHFRTVPQFPSNAAALNVPPHRRVNLLEQRGRLSQ